MRHLGTATLKTGRLILRPYRLSDAEDMYQNWVTDAEVTRFWGWAPHTDIGETRALLAGWTREYDDPRTYHWVLEHIATGEAVGYIYLSEIDDEARSAAVHYLLSRRYWNQGLMTEALRRVLAFALETAGFACIHTRHHADNPASGRVMQKAGMRYERTAYREMDPERLSGEYRYYALCREAPSGR